MTEPTPDPPSPYAPPREPLLAPPNPIAVASVSGVSLFTSLPRVPDGLEFAGSWGTRLGAKLIDWVYLFVVQTVAGGLVGVLLALQSPERLQRLQAGGLSWFEQIALGTANLILFFLIAEALSGTTLGKRIFGLGVVSETLEPISWVQSTKRNVALMLDTLFFGAIGLVAIAGSETGQRNGDSWAKTWVVKRRSAAAILVRYPLSLPLALLLATIAIVLVLALGLVILI
jgi:uncharacterized RDD family membrane protein YckC